MKLTRRQQTQLYIAVWAEVQARLVQGKATRQKPQACAHLAREHAEAAVKEARIRTRK